MNFAVKHDTDNQWFCMLTDSCCPIISPKKFRYLFFKYYNKSILHCRKSWWNNNLHKRANLELLPQELQLANDPWFVMKRENVLQCLHFTYTQEKLMKTICGGDVANESLFAIIMHLYKQLNIQGKKKPVISCSTHLTDWSRMTSTTSPHLFKNANENDITFIESELKNNKFSIFIRKISPEFPNDTLRYYIYKFSKNEDDKLVIREPFIFIFNRYKKTGFMVFIYGSSFFLVLLLLELFKNIYNYFY